MVILQPGVSAVCEHHAAETSYLLSPLSDLSSLLFLPAPCSFPFFLNVLQHFCVLQNSRRMQMTSHSSGRSSQRSGTYGAVDYESQASHPSLILLAAGTNVAGRQKTPGFALLLGGEPSGKACRCLIKGRPAEKWVHLQKPARKIRAQTFLDFKVVVSGLVPEITAG